MKELKWKFLGQTEMGYLDRAKVKGGYLWRTASNNGQIAICFQKTFICPKCMKVAETRICMYCRKKEKK